MLEQISFRNFRRHESIEVAFADITVLVGPNNIGKSAVVDGLHLLSSMSKYSPFRFPSFPKGTFEGQVRVGSANEIGITAKFRSGVDYSLLASAQKAGQNEFLNVLAERLTLNEATQIERRDGSTPEGPLAGDLFPFLRSSTAFGALNQAQRNNVAVATPSEVQSAHQFLKKVGNYRMVPPIVAQSGSASQVQGASPNVSYNGRGLTDLLAYIAEFEPRAFSQIVDDLRQAVDNFETFDFGPAEEPQDQQFLAVFSDGRGAIPAPQLSDGTLNLVALVTVLRSPRQFQLMCLEEPEQGLTPRSTESLVKSLVGGAATADGSQPQIVVSTHSPFLLSSLVAHTRNVSTSVAYNVIRYDPKSDATVCEPLSVFATDFGGFDEDRELSPGDAALLLNYLFGVRHGRA